MLPFAIIYPSLPFNAVTNHKRSSSFTLYKNALGNLYTLLLNLGCMLNVLHVMCRVPLLLGQGRSLEHTVPPLCPIHLDFLSVEIRLRAKAIWEEKERRQETTEDDMYLVLFQPGVGLWLRRTPRSQCLYKACINQSPLSKFADVFKAL